MRILFVRPNKDVFGYKPIGISLLSALLKQDDHKTKLLDTTEIDFGNADSKKTLESISVFKPVDYGNIDMNKKKVDLRNIFFNTLPGSTRISSLLMS